MNKLLQNLKHLPTTIVGAAGVAFAITQDPTVQQLAGVNPRVAHIVGAIGAVSTGLMLIFGVGSPSK